MTGWPENTFFAWKPELLIAALILAGGEARRMGGGDKPLLALNGRSLLSYVVAALSPDHAHIALSANGDARRFAQLGLPVLADPLPGQGPLGGLLAGLDWAAGLGADALLTVPGDTPFVPTGLAAALGPAPAVAESGGRTHHLVATWPVAAAPALRGWLMHDGSRSVGRFAATLSPRVVAFPGDPFFNINTPEDFARAAAMCAPR